MSKVKKLVAIMVTLMMVLGTIAVFKGLGATYGCAIGGICLVAIGAIALLPKSAFIRRKYGYIVLGTSVISAVLAIMTGFLTSHVIIGVLTAIIALSIIFAILKKSSNWLRVVLAVIAIVGFILMMGMAKTNKMEEPENPDEVVTEVSIEQYNALLERLEELTSENETLKTDLEEALNSNEEVRRLYEEHKARCGNCPICNGEMTLEDIQNLKENGTTGNDNNGNKNNTPATSGEALGDGAGNGAGNGGKGSVTPIYDENPNGGKVVTDTENVDLTDDNKDNDEIVVDDNHGNDDGKGNEDDKPVVEEDKNEETQKLSYSIEGNVITVTAPEGYKAVSEPMYYIVGSDNVKVINVTVDNNVIAIVFEASDDAKITICKGMFKKDNVKSEELQIDVTKTEKPSEEEPEEPKDEETPDEPVAEMFVTAINIETICDNGYEGDSLQFTVNAEGQNIDFTKFVVSIGSVSADGTWTFTAPAESGTATISYGEVSKTVEFTVLTIGNNEEETEEPTENETETPSDEPGNPENPGTGEPSDEETETPDEPVAEMFVTAINIETICDNGYEGDSLQFTVNAEGQNIDYTKFVVSIGSVSADGTWTFTAPAESGTATISYGEISQTVEFTVLTIGNNEEEAEEPTENETPSDEKVETETPSDEESEPEVIPGKLTGISMFDSSVICGSDIQGEISFEGNVDWSQVTVAGLNGLSYDISNDGTITIHTSEVASNYVITVSYNGSSVTAEFAVEGVNNPDIVW